MIYTINESMFKKKFKPSNENDYLNFLNNILKNNYKKYKKLIIDGFNNTSIKVEFSNDKFTSQQLGVKAIAYIARLNTKSKNDIDSLRKNNVIQKVLDDINDFNKSNNLNYIKAYLFKQSMSIGLYVVYKDIKDLVESSISENYSILKGMDADNFLENIGVSIDTDNNTISIGEFTMDGYLGQTILAKNGIVLNDDHILINK